MERRCRDEKRLENILDRMRGAGGSGTAAYGSGCGARFLTHMAYIIRSPEKFVSLSGLIRRCVGIMKMLFVIKANKVMCYNTCVP